MKHLSEEELVEHFYSKDATGAGRHLADCAECAEAFAALRCDLDGIESAAPPARHAAYGERVWRAIAPALPAYEASKQSWLRFGLGRGLNYAAACALLIACAFYAGRQWEHRQPRITHAKQAPPEVKPRVVVVLLGDHLDRSERLLVELKHADAGSEEMISPLRDEARSLLPANRICRQKAEKSDDPELAAALDHLDHLLAELASQQGELNTPTLARLQNEMNSNSLLFEVRVLRSRIPDQQPAADGRSNGGTV